MSPMATSMHETRRTIAQFVQTYPKFRERVRSGEFRIILKYLLSHRDKLVWAIEDMDSPPLAAVARGLLELGVDFEDANTRRMTGALIASILSGEFRPISSGHRVNRGPFRTASKYERVTR